MVILCRKPNDWIIVNCRGFWRKGWPHN